MFLDEATKMSPIPVSVKTRLGIADVHEYERILDIYCRYPLAELIVHPRLLEDGYGGAPCWEAFGQTLAQAPFPVTYNGDIFSLVLASCDAIDAELLARGTVADADVLAAQQSYQSRLRANRTNARRGGRPRGRPSAESGGQAANPTETQSVSQATRGTEPSGSPTANPTETQSV